MSSKAEKNNSAEEETQYMFATIQRGTRLFQELVLEGRGPRKLEAVGPKSIKGLVHSLVLASHTFYFEMSRTFASCTVYEHHGSHTISSSTAASSVNQGEQ